jgi:hypothetical protein
MERVPATTIGNHSTQLVDFENGVVPLSRRRKITVKQLPLPTNITQSLSTGLSSLPVNMPQKLEEKIGLDF